MRTNDQTDPEDREGEDASKKRRGRKRPLDQAWLEFQALHYVERFEATRASVRRVLEGRIRRRCGRTDEDPTVALDGIDAVIEKVVELGYVDDARFASHLNRRLRQQGQSTAQIRGRLRTKGVPAELIAEVLEVHDSDVELDAAWVAARKRSIGPYCSDPERRKEDRQRHLAILGRRGFSYDVARRVIDSETIRSN